MSILIPIILSFVFPLLLWVGGKLRIAPNLRFKISAIFVLAAWTIISLWILKGESYDLYWCWLAGLLFIAATIVLIFLPWSVLCWGYTLSMLLRLSESDEAISPARWAKAYAGSTGIGGLSKNRASVLVGMGMAYIDGEDLVLTKFGCFSADFLSKVSRLFGVQL